MADQTYPGITCTIVLFINEVIYDVRVLIIV